MKKIKRYQGDSWEFHKRVVDSKRNRPKDPTYKFRINALENVIKEQFVSHDTHFQRDGLASLSSKTLTDEQKNDLRSLYDYGTKPFQQLNDLLTTGDNGTRQPVCPFCTINNVNTLDHLIPRSEFSEFSDHPINLMPCCSDCNGRKSSNWWNGNVRKYLNLYIDQLPSIQYLFVQLSIENGTIKVMFYIENRGNIEGILFQKIENHYRDLDLCKRFVLNSDNCISELKNIFNPIRRFLSKEQLKQSILETETQNRSLYGFNYWKSILNSECCNNNVIFDYLFP